MSRLAILKGGTILTLGNGLSALSSFLRNIIIARFISVEDFGIASLFALAMSAVEMASNLAVDKVIIQDREGDSRSFQASGHTFLVLRGLISGLVLFFAAGYLADFFSIPQAAWAFQILAVVPVIKGFLHLDSARFQREMNFTPIVLIETLPQILILLLSWPLVEWLGSYEVVIWLIIIQSIMHVVLSHTLASRGYQLGWDNKSISRIYKFGWPLLVNGILMFAILQGDKAIVGATYSMETLGWYSAAFILTLAPAMIINKVIYSLMLPWIAKVNKDKELLKQRSMLVVNYCLFIGLLLSIFFSLIGSQLLILLFGSNYSLGAELVALLAFMQFLRLAKGGPMIVSMGLGNTKNPMIANFTRGAAFLVAILLAWLGYDVYHIIIAGIIGEFLAFVVSLLLLFKSNSIIFLKSSISCFLLGFIIMAYSYSSEFINSSVTYTLIHIIISMISIYISLHLMPAIKTNMLIFLNTKTSSTH